VRGGDAEASTDAEGAHLYKIDHYSASHYRRNSRIFAKSSLRQQNSHSICK